MRTKLISPLRLVLEELVWSEIGALTEEIASEEQKSPAEASLEALGQCEHLIAEAEGFAPQPTRTA